MIKFEDYISLSGKPTKEERREAFAQKHSIDSFGYLKKTDKSYWMRTDPNNPPFKEGQKVWIKSSMASFLDHDGAHLLESPQIINKIIPIPCSEINLWGITLKGCVLVLTSQDVERYD